MYKMEKFGESIAALFDRKQIKDIDVFCAGIGLDSSELYRWRAGTTVPTPENLIKLADVFGYTLDFVIGREEKGPFGTFRERPPFARHLREVMEAYGISCRELTRVAHVGRNTVCVWLRGDGKPGLRSLIRLADALDCSLDYLVGRTTVGAVDRTDGFGEGGTVRPRGKKLTPALSCCSSC